MNKKTMFLLCLLIILVSMTITYTMVIQPATENNHPTDTSIPIDQATLTNEIDTSLLDENQNVDIGEII